MTVFFLLLDAAGWQYGEILARNAPLYLQATTACLAAIVMTQLAALALAVLMGGMEVVRKAWLRRSKR